MNTFKKEERLCSKKVFEKIFKSGNATDKYPFKALWINASFDIPYPAQIAISVPKKNFKKAVVRNLIKRRIREAYRLNKSLFYKQLDTSEKKIQMVIIYVSKEILPYSAIENNIAELLRKLVKIKY
ncbi:MAG: ribonuclease P protein component [Bacteroidales bacterium]|nr:ribonuclease P protein component [Bacteroidales bacterium]